MEVGSEWSRKVRSGTWEASPIAFLKMRQNTQNIKFNHLIILSVLSALY